MNKVVQKSAKSGINKSSTGEALQVRLRSCPWTGTDKDGAVAKWRGYGFKACEGKDSGGAGSP